MKCMLICWSNECILYKLKFSKTITGKLQVVNEKIVTWYPYVFLGKSRFVTYFTGLCYYNNRSHIAINGTWYQFDIHPYLDKIQMYEEHHLAELSKYFLSGNFLFIYDYLYKEYNFYQPDNVVDQRHFIK